MGIETVFVVLIISAAVTVVTSTGLVSATIMKKTSIEKGSQTDHETTKIHIKNSSKNKRTKESVETERTQEIDIENADLNTMTQFTQQIEQGNADVAKTALNTGGKVLGALASPSNDLKNVLDAVNKGAETGKGALKDREDYKLAKNKKTKKKLEIINNEEASGSEENSENEASQPKKKKTSKFNIFKKEPKYVFHEHDPEKIKKDFKESVIKQLGQNGIDVDDIEFIENENGTYNISIKTKQVKKYGNENYKDFVKGVLEESGAQIKKIESKKDKSDNILLTIKIKKPAKTEEHKDIDYSNIISSQLKEIQANVLSIDINVKDKDYIAITVKIDKNPLKNKISKQKVEDDNESIGEEKETPLDNNNSKKKSKLKIEKVKSKKKLDDTEKDEKNEDIIKNTLKNNNNNDLDDTDIIGSNSSTEE